MKTYKFLRNFIVTTHVCVRVCVCRDLQRVEKKQLVLEQLWKLELDSYRPVSVLGHKQGNSWQLLTVM